MEDVLLLIINGLGRVVENAQKLTFSAFGFNISLWDLQLTIFVLSVVFPLFFTLRSPQFASLFRAGSPGSERNDSSGGGPYDYSKLFKRSDP